MTFFNRKEEVLDIQLTQYGKYLLSRGKFKPELYAFFDDDIVYDTNHASASLDENQNLIGDRIRETPRLRTQYLFHDLDFAEKSTFTEVELGHADHDSEMEGDHACCLIGKKIITIQQKPERHYTNSAPLGVAEPGNQFAPSWRINFLKAELSGSVLALSGSDKPTQRVPQLDVDVIYRTGVGTEDRPAFERTSLDDIFAEEDRGVLPINDESEGANLFADSTTIEIKRDFILLEVEENNGFTLGKNFDIEVFKIDETVVAGQTKETLVPLRFSKEEQQSTGYVVTADNLVTIENSFDLEEDIQPLESVSYYLNVLSDSEISEQILCALAPPDKRKGLFSKRAHTCTQAEPNSRKDIYGLETEYEDPCEE